ncbi:hypothetical protein J4E90_000514 [Alternaria incomplexa]|uniref:uncharacterized protein n=1 Tax=Alternaria incomplexa TaxID=1187928 RepID=UPI002220D9F2|nr:uncharacterized protein J4E90_000514 [Alternaria incomplexa]KAI4922086.1 hypothetical protein J4E90_000514 [Alternaria incomplexa]
MAPALPTQDYYVTLGVRPSALYGEIKTSYRRLALLHHPDKNIGSQHATATIQLINAAWEVLKDATKRSEYDRSRQQRTASSSGSQPYAPSPATSQPNPQPHPQNETPAQREARAQAENNRIRQEWLNYERSQKEQIRQCRNTVKSLEAELECLNRNVFENRAKLANDNQSEAGTLAFLSNRLSEQEKSDITLATINAENVIRIKQIRLDEARVRLEQLNDDLTKRKNQEGERLVAELAEKARKERLAKEKAEQARQWEQTRQAWEAEQRAEKESRKARKKAKREAEQKARQAAEQKAGWEAAKKAAREAEEYAREEAEYWATQKEERRMREEAEYWARKEAEEYARQEEKHRAREEAERRTREQAELRARRKAEHRARQEAAHRARQEESRKRAAKEHAAKQYEATAAERSRARRSNCDHDTLWIRVEGQHTCAFCIRILDEFSRQCFGCGTKACVTCAQKLKGGGDTCVRR